MLKLGILVSGRGSNLQAIIDAIKSKKLKVEISVVVSNVAGAFAIERAKKSGIKTAVVNGREYQDKSSYEKKVINTLVESDVDLVCLAGYMRLLSPEFVKAFAGRIMNIHPALLPAFPGLHVQKKALDYGVKYSGCTVHFVDEGCDTGPIIIQAVVPVLDDDTEDTLSARILEQEHKIYPEAIRLYSEGKLHIEGRRVKIVKN
jgi:phosphoribosylglycinamide formyltransferase 1